MHWYGVHVECSLLQILAALWVNLHNIEGVFPKQNNSENNWNRGVSGIGPLCFRRGSNCFLKIMHGEPFKYEFVFLPLCCHLGDIRSICQSSSCIVQIFQELLLGQVGVIFEMHMWHRMEEIHGILTSSMADSWFWFLFSSMIQNDNFQAGLCKPTLPSS